MSNDPEFSTKYIVDYTTMYICSKFDLRQPKPGHFNGYMKTLRDQLKIHVLKLVKILGILD
jgi:hypothetical protein